MGGALERWWRMRRMRRLRRRRCGICETFLGVEAELRDAGPQAVAARAARIGSGVRQWWRLRRLRKDVAESWQGGKTLGAEAVGGDPCAFRWREAGCLRGRVLYAAGADRERALREAQG